MDESGLNCSPGSIPLANERAVHVSPGTGKAQAIAADRPFFCGAWPFVVLLVLGLVGTFATGFLAYRHVLLASHSAGMGQSLLCPADGKVNCDALLVTEYSTLFGYFSSAVLGLMGFVFVLWCAINSLLNDRMRKVAWVMLVAYFFAAIGFSWYYAYIMMFEVDFICTWCIVVHIVNLLSLILVIVVSIKRKKAFLLPEIAPLGERVYFVTGAFLLPLMVFLGAGYAEKSLSFTDAKQQYEELANDTTVVMAVIKGSPTFEIPISPTDPVYGSPAAPYPLVFFSDFQCPGCAKIEKGLKDLVRRNHGVLKLVFKNFPLSRDCNKAVIAEKDFHPMACLAARAAYAAYLIGGPKAFWRYGELLFENQKALKKQPWTIYAEKLNLDTKKLEELMKPDSPAAAKVAQDIELGLKLQLDGTPRVFFEGKRIPDAFSAEYLLDALEELIRTNHPDAQDVKLKRY